MSCTISGRVALLQSAGTTSGIQSKRVYLLPSRTDFEFSVDGGTTWQNWQGDLNLQATYPGAIAATTDSAGTWSFTVPWTDSSVEVQLPGGAPIPDLFWNIIDPNPATGLVVYTGQTPQSIVGTSKTIHQLIALAPPATWTVGAVTYSAVPVGPRRFVTVAFTSALASASIVFPDIGSANWKFSHGIESDDTGPVFYTVKADTASKTNIGGTLHLSDLPPAGKTVLVHIEAYL